MFFCAAPLYSYMKIQGDTICLHPWDMEIIARYGGLKGFLDAEESHREQTAMPFLPSVHQAVDVLCSENEEQVSYLRHNLRLRLLYKLSNSSAFCYRTAVISKRDKTSRILHILILCIRTKAGKIARRKVCVRSLPLGIIGQTRIQSQCRMRKVRERRTPI